MSDIGKLLANAREGRTGDIARLLSIVENEEPEAANVVRATYAHTGRAILVGFTGPPGSGKSTLVSALTAVYRQTAAARRSRGSGSVEPVHWGCHPR